MTCDHLSSQASNAVSSGGSGAEPPSPWNLGDVYLHLETCEQLLHAGHVLTALTELRAAKRELERELQPTKTGVHLVLAQATLEVMLRHAKHNPAQAAQLRLVLMPQHTARELRAFNSTACKRFVRWLADRLEVLA